MGLHRVGCASSIACLYGPGVRLIGDPLPHPSHSFRLFQPRPSFRQVVGVVRLDPCRARRTILHGPEPPQRAIRTLASRYLFAPCTSGGGIVNAVFALGGDGGAAGCWRDHVAPPVPASASFAASRSGSVRSESSLT